MKTFVHVNSKIGGLTLTAHDNILSGIFQDGQKNFPQVNDLGDKVKVEYFAETITQLEEYFNGERTVFDIEYFANGTAFQNKTWDALKDVPYGKTITYGELASMTGNVKAVRAVASSLGKNPLTILVPCHRVLAANDFGGYAGGIENKLFLLNLEK